MTKLPAPRQVEESLDGLIRAVRAFADTPDVNGQDAQLEIIARAKTLIRSVMTPDRLPMYHGFNMAELVSIRTLMKLKVLEAIPKEGSISLQNLAKSTGMQESLLERLTRVVVTSGFLEQTRPENGGQYAHTEFSRSYLLESVGPGHRFLALYDEWCKPMHNFDEYLAQKGQLQHAAEPDDPVCNPYTSYYKQNGASVWAIMEKHPERLFNFQMAMSGFDRIVPAMGYFDFGRFRNTPDEAAAGRVQLVDVGGGTGIVLKQILAAHSDDIEPGACVLQDLAHVVQLSRTDGSLPEAVRRLEHDFLEEQPIKGAKAYILRMILHDYADTVSERILKRLAAAMAPDSRVLIYEMVLPPRITEHNLQLLVVDFAVLCMSGKERTREGFAELLDAADLMIVEVWRQPGIPGACIEARLKQWADAKVKAETGSRTDEVYGRCQTRRG